MDVHTYPICKVPYEIENVSSLTPRQPEKPIEPKLNLPIEPTKPVFSSNGHNESSSSSPVKALLIGIVVIVGLHALVMSSGADSDVHGVFGILYSFVFIAYIFTLVSVGNKEKLKERNRQKVLDYKIAINDYYDKKRKAKEKYSIELNEYKNKLAAYNETIAGINKPNAISEFRRNLKINFFSKAQDPIKVTETYKKGVSEDYFHDYLRRYFGNYIKTDMALKDDDWALSRYYNPDFIFHDPETISIDIEIDEPYIGQTGEPIHYIGSHEARDNYFLENKWIVIRFAEEQVIKEPENCCYFIAEKIFEFTDNKTFLNKLKNHRSPKQLRKWTKDEAHKLAFIRYRSLYLDISFNEKLKDEINLRVE